MSEDRVTFDVDQAGCEACVARVSGALEAIAEVVTVELNAEDDLATVTLRPKAELSAGDVNRALAAASAGSGHEYQVRPGSWRAD